jgi:anti-sigma28 factor (negative regulator of flagellin synthesis)
MDNRLEFAEANLRRELCRRVKELPEMREHVVNALRHAIESGVYRVRDEDIAEAICSSMKGHK